MKTCQKWYVEKSNDFFGKDAQKVDGLSSYCKECLKKRSNYQRQRNKEQYKKYFAEYREKNRDLLRERSKIDYYVNWEKRRRLANENYYKRRELIAVQRAQKRRLSGEREKNRIRQKLWRQENRSKYALQITEWKKSNPEKAASHSLILWAIKTGLIKRDSECKQCGKNCKTEGHHENYSKPLEVTWLCKLCHAKKHTTYR